MLYFGTLVGILWFVISFVKGLTLYSTMAPIELDTAEKVDYITKEFNIKNTANIGSYTISFHNGCMTVILNDVKDIYKLIFENLSEYGLTEIDYNEIISTPFDKREYVRSKAALIEYEGTWPNMERKAAKFEIETEDQEYYIIIYEVDSCLYCEVSRGWDLAVSKKLKSME